MGNFSEIINSDQPVLVDFYATWCGPCKTMSPILEQVASKLGEKARIIKIDIDKNQQAAHAYQVQSVPTLIIFKNGNIKWRQSGVIGSEQLVKIIEQYV